MPIEHLRAADPVKHITEVLQRDGCAVIDRLVEPAALDAVRGEMQPALDAAPMGVDEFTGGHTRRVGALISRSAASHALIENPSVLGAVEGILEGATSFHLHLTQIIAIGPGESSQSIHRDQWAFDFFPFPTGYHVQCNTLWAMTDFTEENGATRVIPGSHLYEDKLQFTESDTEPAEMEAGSALLYTGGLYHGGGTNRSDSVRYGLNITYARSWLRQEENQYLSVPQDLARGLPKPLLRLMGYARGAYALGYIDDLRDPLEALGMAEDAEGFGALERARDQLSSSQR